jgi:sugar fermentation stimulation protein A
MRGVLMPHRWPGEPLQARLLARPNRFLALCRLAQGGVVEAHVPDRGRCLDLLVPGQPLILVAASGPLRRTRFTALLAEAKSAPGIWVSLDPAGAPRLVEAALAQGLLRSLAGHTVARREVLVSPTRSRGVAREGASRIDLLLHGPRGEVLCEVKSVGAATDGVALFPDAPTLRGSRHLALLSARAKKGLPAAVVFCAQRGDVTSIRPDELIDPEFAKALRAARRAGVLIVGLVCEALPEGMRLRGEVEVAGLSNRPRSGTIK